MRNSPDPSIHRAAEARFIEHVERMLDDDRLRLDTTRGRKSILSFVRAKRRTNRAVDLKRLMSDLGRPDRELQARMPQGETVEVEVSQKRWWVLQTKVGKVRAMCISPARALLSGHAAPSLTRAEVESVLSQCVGPVPTTVVLMSTSGFVPDARQLAQRNINGAVVLVEPNDAGGFALFGPPDLTELLDPEAEQEKRDRIRRVIEGGQTELSGSGLAADRIAERTQLAAHLVEAELRSYAREHPGLTARKLDGRLVLFRESSAVADATPGGIAMPMIDKIRSLFTRKGETEKKIAFLSERRAALGQQRDRSYEEIATLEQQDTALREQFKNAGADLAKRRITSQLLQLRKDMERRQQLLTVLNQQINVVSTHLHNLELVQQGQTAKLPDSEEMASDAAAAEEMLAMLQESSEMAESVGGVASSGLSAEEQALYEELQRESGASASSATIAEPPTSATVGRPVEAPPASIPVKQPPRRNEPEAG